VRRTRGGPGARAAGELIGDHGSGRVTDATAHGLADGVRELIALPVVQRRAAARAAAERFPWSATVAGLLTLYQRWGDRSQAAAPPA
jgi:alpha-1,6-mannosyltransferase